MKKTAILMSAVIVGVISAFAAAQPASPIKTVCPTGYESGARIEKNLYQLTGTDYVTGQASHPFAETSDPAPPLFNPDGSVDIYSAANFYIHYRTQKEFEAGGCFLRLPLQLTGADSFPWDVRKFEQVDATGAIVRNVIVGGGMSASKGNVTAKWPEDNISRRVYTYLPTKDGRFAQSAKPIVGDITTGWTGHSYGGNFIQEDAAQPNVIRIDGGRTAFFYEKVSVATSDGPQSTEIFATEVNPKTLQAIGEEKKILTNTNPPYPASKRVIGGTLMEGPRPMQVQISGRKFFIFGFSAGDFFADDYTISYGWANDLMGPYRPALLPNGSDLIDLGTSLKKRFGLSWVGRPAFFKGQDGGYEMLFHGLKKSVLPDNDYTQYPQHYELQQFYRVLFKVKVKLSLDAKGMPVMALEE